MDIENRAFTAGELEIISTANAEIDEIKERCDMLIVKFCDWIVSQSNDVKGSAADAFGIEMKTLGKMLSRVADDEN